MKILVSLVAALVLLAPEAEAKPGHAEPVMALVTRGHSQVLTSLDGLTLSPLAPGRTVGRESASILSRSPGGTRVAVLSDYRWFAVFDLARGRLTRWQHVGDSIVAGIWTRPNRLALLDSGAGVYTVTLGRRTVLRWHPIDGTIVSWTTAGNRFVALVAPIEGIGPAKLAVADDAGAVRTVDLPGVLAGQASPTDANQAIRIAVPGLAVDPSGTRVAIVQKLGPPLVVDLRTLAFGGRSLAIAHKLVSGYVRTATWFAPDLIAVTGEDAAGEEQWTPAGLTLVDATTGARRPVESGVTHTLASATLLACGSGLSGYGPTGRRMFHALGSARVARLAAVGPYAYATSDGTAYSVVDAASGEVVAQPTAPAETSIVGGW